jgi:hypothetical protein
LGPDKKLNEIVMAGSHDAGITAGGGNVQTQSRDIHGQAVAGVRIFDLRIAAATVPGAVGGVKQAELKAFHADGMLQSKKSTTRHVAGLGGTQMIERTKLRGGAFGLGLNGMLAGALQFVQDHPNEFLLLKFDKCTNWSLIAQACVNVLGGALYRGGGNLNTKSLRDLRGKVIPLFTSDGMEAIAAGGQYGPATGILGIKNLYGGKASYQDRFDGLQYFGKGGTSPFNPRNKIKQNLKKQQKILSAGGEGNPNVMGMMYWTTTGLFESIEQRDRGMWTQPNVAALKRMWNQGLEDAIQSRAAKYASINGFAGGQRLKAFMPNMVMIDFADETKCGEIFQLNTTPVTVMIDAFGLGQARVRAA